MSQKSIFGFDIENHSCDPIELEEDNDKYNYFNFSKSVANTIASCKTPLVIGIYGRWGTGKTTILRTIKKILKNCKTPNYYFYDYTPWQYILNDFEDVWTSFIAEIEKQGKYLGTKLKDVADKAKKNNYAKKIGNILTGYVSGGSVKGFAETQTHDLIMDVKKAFEEGVEESIGDDDKNRVIIFIDDLDRCEEKISVEVLRVIQLVCRIEGCVFLLGIDREVINNNLKTYYDDEVFAMEYLDKMIQLHMLIPSIENEKIVDVILHKTKGEKRQYFCDLSPKVLKILIELLDSNPRKIERFLSLYDFKFNQWGLDNPGVSFSSMHFRDLIMYSIIELRWPKLATVDRITKDLIRSINVMSTTWTDSNEIIQHFGHIQNIESFLKDKQLKNFFNTFYAEKFLEKENKE